MRLKWKMTLACLKMFFRQKQAVFWTLFLPLFMITLFGFVRFDRMTGIDTGVVGNPGGLLDSLKQQRTFNIHSEGKLAEFQALQKGDRDLVLEENQAGVTVYMNDARPQQAQVGVLLVQQMLDERALKQSGAQRIVLERKSVKSRNLTYMDFLVPGIMAMSIMQMGIFSVAFVFVDLKKRGILRRLRVTPINTNDFILAQVVTRLIVLCLQVLVLTAAGVLFFHLHFIGNIWSMLLLGVLGAIVFLGMGFSLAGISRSEDQVAPLANVVTLPQLLLSGIFFSRASLPGFAHVITNLFPLTFLADGLRSVAIEGANLTQIGPNLLGLAVWCVLTTGMAIKFFRWE